VLLAQVLEQLQPGAHLQHVRRRDPRLGQPPVGEQLAQQSGVGAVGLGPPFRSARGRGVGRLGQMRLDPGALQLLDDEPPAGAALDRERRRVPASASRCSSQPRSSIRSAGAIRPCRVSPLRSSR
jgi:hypothetical protein